MRSLEESGALYFFIISKLHACPIVFIGSLLSFACVSHWLALRDAATQHQEVARGINPNRKILSNFLVELGLTTPSWKTAYTREDQSICPLTSPDNFETYPTTHFFSNGILLLVREGKIEPEELTALITQHFVKK